MAVTQRRKLLTAAVGVATVSYVVACGGLEGGDGGRAGHGGAETSGNLVSPPGEWFEGGSGGQGYGGAETSGNLVAPPPPPALPDSGAGGTVSEAQDSGVPADADTTDSGASPDGWSDASAEPVDAAVD